IPPAKIPSLLDRYTERFEKSRRNGRTHSYEPITDSWERAPLDRCRRTSISIARSRQIRGCGDVGDTRDSGQFFESVLEEQSLLLNVGIRSGRQSDKKCGDTVRMETRIDILKASKTIDQKNRTDEKD